MATGGSYETAPVSFRNPPVIEVALSVQFEPALFNSTKTLGDFWPLVRAEYPQLDQQPSFPPQTEDFGPPRPLQVEMMAAPPPPRYWFVSDSGERLIQVQPDRLVFNWRKTDDAEQYPRYRELRPEFESRLHQLLDVLTEEERSSIHPTWCEVTYVNHILGDTDSHSPSLGEVLTTVTDPPAEWSLPEIEDAQLLQRFRITGAAGEPVGRLHVTAAPGVRNLDQRPLLALTLVARTRPEEGTAEGALASVDRGRELIVRGFSDLTTPEMHEKWGLEH